MPPGLTSEIGNATFSRLSVISAETRALPLKPDFALGMFRKTHRMYVLRLEGPAQWVLINIHLSAFDDAIASVREKQLSAVLAFAEAEYSAGRHVVIGGDWNMRLAATEFPIPPKSGSCSGGATLTPRPSRRAGRWAPTPPS